MRTRLWAALEAMGRGEDNESSRRGALAGEMVVVKEDGESAVLPLRSLVGHVSRHPT